jgi:hypothetical protein
MVSLSLIGKIRFRVSGKRESLVPIGQALLALKRGDHTLVRQPDDPKFSAPRNEQGLADATTGSLINDARAKNGGEAPQQNQENLFHGE